MTSKEKVKKRPKVSEKTTSKIKRIEEKFMEISSKLNNKEKAER